MKRFIARVILLFISVFLLIPLMWFFGLLFISPLDWAYYTATQQHNSYPFCRFAWDITRELITGRAYPASIVERP